MLLWTRSYAARRTTPQSATLDLHPVIHVPNYMDYYSFTDPLRDGWLSWPCWLTDSRRLNHKIVTHPAVAVWRRIRKFAGRDRQLLVISFVVFTHLGGWQERHLALRNLSVDVHGGDDLNTALHVLEPRAGSKVRIDPLSFLAGCRKRRLNQALSVLSLSLCVIF